MKPGRPFRDPADELLKAGVSAQGVDRVIIARQIGFAECCVNFIVTDLVKQHRRPAFAAPKPWREVVQALPDIGGDGPVAKRADRIAHGIEFGTPCSAGKGDTPSTGEAPASLTVSD